MRLKKITSLLLCGLLTFAGVGETAVTIMAAEQNGTMSTRISTVDLGNSKAESGKLITVFHTDPAIIADNSNARSTGNVAINSTNFPDAKFRAAVQYTYDDNNNYVLSAAERNIVSVLNANAISGIKNFKGIEHFSNLTGFQYTNSGLTKLDLSKNSKLTTLYCFGNSLTSLKVPASVTELQAHKNKLSSVSGLAKCKKMKVMSLDNNHFTKLPNLRSFAAINYLDLTKNYLTKKELTAKLPTHAVRDTKWLNKQVKGQHKIAKPTKLKVAKSGSKAFKVSWKKKSGVTGYQVAFATRKNGRYKNIKSTKSSSYTHKKLKKGTTYFYKVRSYKTVGKTKVYSAWTGIKSRKR